MQRKEQDRKKQERLLTSSGELVIAWASRETSGSLAFFERLLLRVSGTFFTEALVTLGATSRAGGSSSIAGGIEGVAVSSSSLHEAKN
jgi:hypothetical protein